MPTTPLPASEPGVTAPPAGWLDDFSVEISFDGPWTVLSVRGDLDLATAPRLRSVILPLVDGGHQSVALDLSALTFMSAAGLGVIVATLSRLAASDGLLALRSVPKHTSRILQLAGIDGRVIIQPPASTADLRSNLTRAAALPERNRAVDAQLSLIVALADATVDGADGVSVTLRRSGRVSTVAASNDTVLRMDAHQYETGEGPCLSAASEGRAFHIESLSGESRWPAFVALALEQGIASILSTPLRAADETIGALNIYSNTERAFGSYQSELSEVLAAQASQFLTDAAAHPSDAEMAPRIAAALRSRLILAQAQGVLMARHRVSADEATNTLHRLARAAESSVLVHAAEVVASTYVGVDSIARLGHG